MRHIEADYTTEDLDKALDRLYRRIRALELESGVVMPSSAPRSPSLGASWLDVGAGEINVWNGSTWNIYQKV